MTSFIEVVIQAIVGHKYSLEIAATAMDHLTWLHDRRAAGQLATAWYAGMSQDDAPWVEAHWIPVICQAISEVPVTLVLPSVHNFNDRTWGRFAMDTRALQGMEESDGHSLQDLVDMYITPNMIAHYSHHFFPISRHTLGENATQL